MKQLPVHQRVTFPGQRNEPSRTPFPDRIRGQISAIPSRCLPIASGFLRRFQVSQFPERAVEPNRTRNPALARQPLKVALAETIPQHHFFAGEQGTVANKLLKPLDSQYEFVTCEFEIRDTRLTA